jgi:large subunit ribosomal protein L31e
MADLERIYTIPLRSAYDAVRGKRSRKAIKIVRSFISRHMKAEMDEVSISEGVNKLIWKRGIQKPPRKIKVRAVKAGEGVSVLLVDEKVGEAKVEKAPAKKEEKEAAPAKDEPKEKPEAKPKGEPAKAVKEEAPKPQGKKEEGSSKKE